MTISITNSISSPTINISQESTTTVGSIKAIVIEQWGAEYKLLPCTLWSGSENINSDKKLMEIIRKKDACIKLKLILTTEETCLDVKLLLCCKGISIKNDYYGVNKDPFIERIREMITKGAYLDVIDDDGFTPLQLILEKSKDQGEDEAIKAKHLEEVCKTEEEKMVRTTIAEQPVSLGFKIAKEKVNSEGVTLALST